MDNVFDQVEKNIDNLVINNADWTASATKEALDSASDKGKSWTIYFKSSII